MLAEDFVTHTYYKVAEWTHLFTSSDQKLVFIRVDMVSSKYTSAYLMRLILGQYWTKNLITSANTNSGLAGHTVSNIYWNQNLRRPFYDSFSTISLSLNLLDFCSAIQPTSLVQVFSSTLSTTWSSGKSLFWLSVFISFCGKNHFERLREFCCFCCG